MKWPGYFSFFEFAKRERNAILIIIIIELAFIIVPKLFLGKVVNPPVGHVKKDIDYTYKLENKEKRVSYSSNAHYSIKNYHRKLQLFKFDPNRLDSTGWVKLGLPDRLIHTLINYRNKGGRFRLPEDIRKIWGINKEMADQLIPLIDMETNAIAKDKNYISKYQTEQKIELLEMNSADSAQWESLPGIGPILAARIIAYRNKLGGFVSLNQLHEVWGLSDSTFQKIASRVKVMSNGTEKKDINTSTWQELKSHPYIGYKLANTIVRYRNQHGNFKTLKDIQQMLELDEKSFQRLQYYFKVSSEN